MKKWRFAILLNLICLSSLTGLSQIRFKLELLSDDSTYQVSMVPEVSWTFPWNLTSSAQVTIRVPHGEPPYGFVVTNLTPLQANTDWIDNVRINAPLEAPAWDYISFAMLSLGTDAFNYEVGQEIPIFSFTNAADACADSISLVNNLTDPFAPPNSAGANIGHNIVTLGGGLMNAYIGNVDSGKAPCAPSNNCSEDFVAVQYDLCEGDPFRGKILLQDTTYLDLYISSNGCDSLIETFVKLQPAYLNETVHQLCLGEEFNGTPYYQNDQITEEYISTFGCDSIQIIHIEVLEPSISNQNLSFCYGETYAGISLSQDTSILESLTAVNGCDSVVTSFIEVHPVDFIGIDTSLCLGEVVYGQEVTDNSWFEVGFQGINGCDSLILQIEVEALSSNSSFEQLLITANEQWQGNTYSNDTLITQNLYNTLGCDSIAQTQLVVFPINTSIIDTIICDGQSLLDLNISNDTILVDSLTNPLEWEVYVIDWNPSPVNQQIIQLCEGEAFEGIIYETDTSFTQVFGAGALCDSVVQVEIYVAALSETFDQISICEGELYNGQSFYSDTTLSSLYVNENGCDSLHQTYISVNPNPNPEINGLNQFCSGEEVELSTESYSTLLWNNGAQSPVITTAQPGIYSVTVSDQNGCTGTASLEIEMMELFATVEASAPRCDDTALGMIDFIEVENGQTPFTYSIDNGQSFFSDSLFQNLSPGNYDIVVEDLLGCQWNHNIQVPQKQELILDLIEDQSIRLGESIKLELQTSIPVDSISWSPSEGLNCSNCLEPLASPLETTTYTVETYTSDGCYALERVTIIVSNPKNLHFPNVFSPNGDGYNDYFYPQAGNSVALIEDFKIFDRHGALVFSNQNFAPNDAELGWNGQLSKKENNGGVYTYFVKVKYLNGISEIVSGDFILMK